MDDLLFDRDNLSEYIYIVGDENLLSISQKTGVPPSLIIFDNKLCEKLREGMALIIKPRGKMRMLLPSENLSAEKKEELKIKNKCEFLFPFQWIID